ncbi:mechanosensitive ion channel family protein [Pelobacter seleniigenes]|uniref:mechanosensitive ion channel family protein n=1 Tax=Pelobacter seleniigenes TaxID=407188 RepID=UPI0004A6AAE9|nr:mechanosensitive ion channel domain-containing protein [Pelobacter seleniigenes]
MDAISADKVIELVQTYGLPLIWAIIIFVIGRIVSGVLANGVAKMMHKSRVDETLVKFARSLTYIALMTFVVLAALSKLGIQTTSFAAVIAAAGLAIGLSLQGTLGNFSSGVMLILFRPFKVGDFVDAGGVSGIIEEIQIFSTKMRSPDNKEIIVPNGQIIGTTITNYSAKETRRVDMVVGVSYSDDLKKVRSVIEDLLNQDARILADPAPTIGVLELGDSSINFAVRPWVKSGDYWPVLFDFHENVKLRFDAEGISIPFPQRDIHIVKEDAVA